MRQDSSINLRNITQLGFTRNSPGPSEQLLRAPGLVYSHNTAHTHTRAMVSLVYIYSGVFTRMGDVTHARQHPQARSEGGGRGELAPFSPKGKAHYL